MDAEGKLIDRIWQSIDGLTTEIATVREGVFPRLEALELQVRTANGKTASNTGNIKELGERLDSLPKVVEARSSALEAPAVPNPEAVYHPIVRNMRGVPAGAWLFLTFVVVLASMQGNIMNTAERIGKYYIERRYPPEPTPSPASTDTQNLKTR